MISFHLGTETNPTDRRKTSDLIDLGITKNIRREIISDEPCYQLLSGRSSIITHIRTPFQRKRNSNEGTYKLVEISKIYKFPLSQWNTSEYEAWHWPSHWKFYQNPVPGYTTDHKFEPKGNQPIQGLILEMSQKKKSEAWQKHRSPRWRAKLSEATKRPRKSFER